MKRLGEEDADGKIATSSDADGKMLPNEGKRRTANDNSEEKTSRSGDEEKDDNKEDASDSEDASPSLRLTAASTPTCWKLIQLIKKLKFTESDCKKIIGALEQSRDLSFLGTRFGAGCGHVGLHQVRPATDELLKKAESVTILTYDESKLWAADQGAKKALVGSEMAISTVHMAVQKAIAPVAKTAGIQLEREGVHAPT
ncbi:uncharacterized protein IUM83_12537 [Phytophthora cinnamomi]|uniref:uncharacterized protein n=1 Tax=Phytophthora cinnamomi TaxID=4785 RepID=UPI00355A0AA2|nr:hypothetical protein IUM83_12537 [Phytophthora cinnamomi]